MDDNIRFLKELQDELNSQDNDGQAAPRFWVIMDHEYQITQEGYHDRVSVFNHSACESYEIEEYAEILLHDDNDKLDAQKRDELRDIMSEHSYTREDALIEWFEENDKDVTIFYEKQVDVIKQNTLFITKQEAKDHLEANSHHYSNKAHTYAMTAWRSPKVKRLLEILEKFNWDAVAVLER